MGIDTRGIAQKGKAHGVTMDGSFGMIPLLRLKAIGETWDNPTVAFIELNAASKIHGLLGLDFLRGRILTVDFRRGTVSLKQPSPWRFWRRLR